MHTASCLRCSMQLTQAHMLAAQVPLQRASLSHSAGLRIWGRVPAPCLQLTSSACAGVICLCASAMAQFRSVMSTPLPSQLAACSTGSPSV